MPFISYASNFEDVLLNRIFGEVDDGFYIDIGADHPTFSSTTKAFYDRGWCGVNVEPGPRIDLLKLERPRDFNVLAAITDFDGEIDFYVNDDLQSTSSIFGELPPAVAARTEISYTKRVPAMTLSSLVEKYVGGREVAFLKIDAEGAEGSIIKGADFNIFRPRIILAESTEPFSNKRIDRDWVELLADKNYQEAYFDGINTWFVRNETPADLEYFRTPVNVLDDFVKYDPHLPKWQYTKALRSSDGKRKSIFHRLRRSLAKRFFKIANVIAP
jgi:FkbM family methyltransferase